MHGVGDNGARELHRVIKAWVAFSVEQFRRQIIVFKIDATNKRYARINHNDFAMQAPQTFKVKRLQRKLPGLGAIDTALRTDRQQFSLNGLFVLSATKAIEHDPYPDPPQRRQF